MSPFIVACPGLKYFSTAYHKRHNFWEKKVTEHQSVFWFYLQILSETFLIIRRNRWDLIKNVYRSPCKVPVIIVRF
jgi:predicted AAA+ superfamily ATPase